MAAASQDNGNSNQVEVAIHSYTENTSLHGIHSATRKDYSWLRRCLWMLFFLGCTAALIFTVTELLITFFAYTTTTRIKIINERVVSFPAVTVCNLNIVKKSKVEAEGEFIAGMMQSMFAMPGAQPKYDLEDEEVLVRARGISLADIYERTKVNVLEMTSRCTFNRLNLTCSEYMTPVMSHLGECYTFNSLSIRVPRLETFRATVDNGLMMNIDIQHDEYYEGTYSAGLQVYVHDPNEYPVMDRGRFVVSPGTQTYVAVMKQEMIELPAPYENGHCVEKSNTKPLRYFDHYSMPACMEECIIGYIIQHCNCTDFRSLKDPNYPHCDMHDFLTCAFPASSTFAQETEVIASCGCRNECSTTTYTPSISTAVFPSMYTARKVQEHFGISPEYITNNNLELTVHLDSMSYIVTETIPAYGFNNLLADIGGQMGLFLGASILTATEFAEVCAILMLNIIKKCCVVKNVKKIANTGSQLDA